METKFHLLLVLAFCGFATWGTLYCIMLQLWTFEAALDLTEDEEQLCRTFTWIKISQYFVVTVYLAVVGPILMKIYNIWDTPGTGQGKNETDLSKEHCLHIYMCDTC